MTTLNFSEVVFLTNVTTIWKLVVLGLFLNKAKLHCLLVYEKTVSGKMHIKVSQLHFD